MRKWWRVKNRHRLELIDTLASIYIPMLPQNDEFRTAGWVLNQFSPSPKLCVGYFDLDPVYFNEGSANIRIA